MSGRHRGVEERGRGDMAGGSSFAGRWLKRLLVVFVALFGALGYGFHQKPGADGLPQRMLPWQDPHAFGEYSIATLTWAKDEGARYAVQAKERIAKIEWTKESQDLYDSAVRFLDGSKPAAPTFHDASAFRDFVLVAETR